MKPCAKCGDLKPLDSFYFRKDNGCYRAECKACHAERTLAWQAENRDRVRSYVRKSCKKAYDADPEKYRTKSLKARKADPEGKRLIVRKSNKKRYYENYSHERARLNEQAAARKRASPPWLTREQREEMRALYAEAKVYERITGAKWHVDHIEPIMGIGACGLHVPWNLQLLTASENCAKKNRRGTS